MKQITTLKEALYLLKEGECFISRSFGNTLTYYYYRNGVIYLRNANLKANISLDEFIDAFDKGKFYLFENEEEIEIDQNDKYWRQ